MSDEKPWWWPVPIDDEWRARIRADYPEETEGMSDESIDDLYAAPYAKYEYLWDHIGDAMEEHQRLADAFLKLVAETGKTPQDFD